MRYQNPSIPEALRRLHRWGAEEIIAVPLFPHYAMSSFETAVEHIRKVLRREMPEVRLIVVPPYFDEPVYIKALAASAEPFLREQYDHLLFSFHGLPERHLKKSDRTGCHCLYVENCCDVESPAHETYYRAQCLKTVAAFVRQTGIPR